MSSHAAIRVRYRPQRHRWEVDARAVGGGRPTFATAEAAHVYAGELLKELRQGTPVSDLEPGITLRAYVTEWTATLRFYARWVPSGDRRWVDLLTSGQGAAGPDLEPECGTNARAAAEAAPKPAKSNGEP